MPTLSINSDTALDTVLLYKLTRLKVLYEKTKKKTKKRDLVKLIPFFD